jgi:hypothetical protein
VRWFDAVGWLGSALLVWSLLQDRILRLRAINMVGCAVLIGYNAVIRVWPMVGLNVVLLAVNVWFLVRLLATRHDERTYQVVEVDAEDGLLRGSTRASSGRAAPDARRSWWYGATTSWASSSSGRSAGTWPRSSWTT